MSAKARGSVWFRFRVAMAKEHEFNALLAAHLRKSEPRCPPPGHQPPTLAERTRAKLDEARALLIEAEHAAQARGNGGAVPEWISNYEPGSQQTLHLAMFMALLEERS